MLGIGEDASLLCEDKPVTKLEGLGYGVESSTLMINHYEVHNMLVLTLMLMSFAFGGSVTMLADPKASFASCMAAGAGCTLATLFTVVYILKLSGGV